MSYMISPRLHFAGKFQADVSTVNNQEADFRRQEPQPPPAGGATLRSRLRRGVVVATQHQENTLPGGLPSIDGILTKASTSTI
jgi:hypothetical protein